MESKNKIIFFGADSFGVPIFNKLADDVGMEVVALATRSPKPAGRGLKPSPNPMITQARSRNIDHIFAEASSDWDSIRQIINKEKPQYCVVASFGKIIPAEILNLLPDRFINVHPSLLPKYRGPSPIETAILEGEKETGLSFITLNDKMDAGPIISQFKTTIGNLDAPALEEKLSVLASEKIVSVLDALKCGELTPKDQREDQANYTHIITKQDGLIGGSDSADIIERKFRAYKNWPGTYFQVDDKVFKISEGIKKGDVFLIKKIQPESKKAITTHDFTNGYREVLTKLPKFVKII